MYLVAIVGSGPAGLSAACRAAQMGDSHILLEAQPHFSNTIYHYQTRKLVMAHPKALPLRAAARFEAGLREKVLGDWSEDLARHAVNVHYRAEVSRIEKTPLGFRLSLLGRPEVIEARNVVLAIGCQGNLRKLIDRRTRLPIPGSELPYVQYQLDDPGEYRQETIVVIGSGDAGIENALGLAAQNNVHIVNSGSEFSKAKEGNVSAVQQAIDCGTLKCHSMSSPEQISALPAGHPSGRRMLLRLNSKDGPTDIPCDRIIARLGADPPQALVKSFGVQFTNDDATALPQLSPHYESNVPGLYIIGALAGYPLIKQSMNQGYEVIEFLTGRPVQPADEPALRTKLARFRPNVEVDSMLDLLHRHSPILSALSRLQLRDFFLESETMAKPEGDCIYRRGDASNSLFIVITGEAVVQHDDADPGRTSAIPAGRCFGEFGLISGRPRAFTVRAGNNCRLIEIPRGTALKLIGSHAAIRDYVDQQYLLRALSTYLAPGASEAELLTLVSTAQLRQYSAKEAIFAAGSAASEIHLVRSGSVTLSSQIGGRDIITSYCAAGQYFGEVDVIAATRRRQGAKAAVKTETIAIRAEAFNRLLRSNPALNKRVREHFRAQLRERLEAERAPRGGAAVEFLVNQGLGEATDALLIDESLCVRCDQCEKACAATHGNVSRLNREAGASFDNLHVPTSCRHCEHPHCMKDCPPDAIHRSVNGEVYINDDCIGCGNCERNCPYGVIQMGVATQEQPSLWRWLVLGRGPAPGSDLHGHPEGTTAKKAVKCDMCKDRGAAGPACVQACPTGAAIRVGPEQFFKVLSRGDR